jgi:hypothetical protein
MRGILTAITLFVVGATGMMGVAVAEQVAFEGATVEYIIFTNVQTDIDLGDLGGPQFTGTFQSAPALVEVDANVFLQAFVTNGANLAAAGGHILPTRFVNSVKGTGIWNGAVFATAGYSVAQTTEAWETWFVNFAPGPGSGLQTILAIDRQGMRDHAGTYQTISALTWSKW